MIKADYHMHTYFSSDSDTPPEAMALGAIKKGLRWICITDHHDWDYPEDKSQFRIDFPRYLPAIRKLKEDFRDRISIQMGVEIGFQKHLGPYYKELADTYPFDFIIGSTHVVDGRELKLKEGELLFLNQHAVQEIQPAGQDDIAVNFIILPEFFDTAFRMMGEEENLLRDFIVGCLCDDTRYGRYLHFQIADVLPVQNLVENLVWSLMHEREGMQAMNQTTMGLLLRHLMHYTGRIRVNRDSEQSFEQQLTLQVLRYIDEHYREGSLTELAALMGYDVYWLSRAINRLLGRNYKELLQIKRLNQAAFLLHSTRMPVADVSFAVGYDNTSYFYRIFRTYYGMSPKEYRKNG